MSPAYKTPEQVERWHKRHCARCGRHGWFAARWPDGYVCRTCHDKALRVRGCCPDCGGERVLPGIRPGDGALICPDCADFMTSYRCSRCGHEGKLHGGRLCTRCTLADKLAELLDDGTGRIRPELVPLGELLLTADSPLSILTWLYMRTGKTGSAEDLLRRLGRGEIGLKHEAFHTLQPWRAASHLRELLMACGILPAIDKQICLFEGWLTGRLASVSDPEHRQIVRRFATWEVLPKLRARADRRPLTPGSRKYAADQVKRAASFLEWLADHDRTFATCGQVDIDLWHVEHKEHERNTIRPFLLWCQNVKLTRRFRLPSPPTRRAAPLSQNERLDLLGQLLTDDSLPLRSRVAGIIVLLYAQPCTRVVRLTVDDVVHENGQVRLRLGEPPSPVPAPFAELLLAWIDNRDNMNTGTNHGSRWIFPGRRAGQPLHPFALSELINDIGVPTTASRTAAIRQQVLEMPAPVVADALGYHQVTTTKLAAEAGGTWSRYAPGDPTRSPAGWTPRGTGDS
ncbi:hypothetical protein [Streptomyces capitiformicae]|uniref:Site-specific recombinase XerD n=1 Tax=Streptomyces capitiformicae TaxID=2014920 RepID=A0A918ZWJ2_9ACTN|nr:hypothetical protein [Streptomyces capitiformicae]GHE72606.1 hypothetical protein GCM10017771_96480 [Streptomyces capitiformicae]